MRLLHGHITTKLHCTSTCLFISKTRLPRAGAPVDVKPTLLCFGLSLICFSIISAPGNPPSVFRLFPVYGDKNGNKINFFLQFP